MQSIRPRALLPWEEADDALQVFPWSRMVASAFGVLDLENTLAEGNLFASREGINCDAVRARPVNRTLEVNQPRVPKCLAKCIVVSWYHDLT